MAIVAQAGHDEVFGIRIDVLHIVDLVVLIREIRLSVRRRSALALDRLAQSARTLRMRQTALAIITTGAKAAVSIVWTLVHVTLVTLRAFCAITESGESTADRG